MKPSIIQLGISILIAAAALGGYVFWYGYVRGLDASSAALAGEIAAKDRERAHAVSARSAEAELAAQEALVASHIVASADIVSFLERLENTGKQFGATVHVASVSDQAKASEGTIALSLSVAGSFDAVMRTIGAIEEGPYAVTVQDLSLDTPDGSQWSATGVFVVGTEKTAP